MRKIILLLVCVGLTFSVYAGRRSSRKRMAKQNQQVEAVFICYNKNCPDFRKPRLPSQVNMKMRGDTHCPKCGKIIKAVPVQH